MSVPSTGPVRPPRRPAPDADPLERITARDEGVTKAAHAVFGYTAGKSIIAKELVRFFPTHKVYTEPFCGSAAMFFVKEAAPTEVLADTNEDVVQAHTALRDLTAKEFENLSGRNWTSTHERFRKILKSSPTDKLDRLYKFLYLARFSFGKRRKSYDHASSGQSSSILKRIEKLQPRYKNATILCADYGKVIAKYDSPDAFHFLDPPYGGYKNGLAEHEFDEVRFRKALDGLKGKFLVTYGVKGKLDTSGYEVKRLQQRCSIRAGIGGEETLTHLLISNFKLAKKSFEAAELDDVMQVIDAGPGGERVTVTGSRTSVSVPAEVGGRMWKGSRPELDYPSSAGPVKATARILMADGRFDLDLAIPRNGETIGWTLKVQRAAAPSLEAVVGGFSRDGNRYVHPLTKGVPAAPLEEAIAEAVGTLATPHVEFGLQEEGGRHEYFLSKGDELVGQLVVERAPSLGEKHPWLATMVDAKFIPNAVLKGGPMPPDGISAIPVALEKAVPEALRYWEHRGAEARKRRDALAASGLFERADVVMVDGEPALALAKYVLFVPEAEPATNAEWPIVKSLAVLPEGARLVEVFSPTEASLAKATADGSTVYVDAGDAAPATLDRLATMLAAVPFVLSALDTAPARKALEPLGRLFQFRPVPPAGADALDRLFVSSHGVRGADLVWLDKADARRKPTVTNTPSDDTGDLGKAAADFNRPSTDVADPGAPKQPPVDPLEKVIRHEKDGWHVYAEDGSKHLGGPYGSKDEAVERLRQVEGHAAKVDFSAGGPGTLQPAVGYDVAGAPKVRDQDEKDRERQLRLMKASAREDGDEHYVLGIVLEPDVVDAQKDTYSADEVREAAHKYMAEFQNRGLMHKELVNGKVDILESYLAPTDFAVGDQSVKKGTWLMAVRVKDAALWSKCKSGALGGFSIGGSANRQPDPKANRKYEARKDGARKVIAFQGIPITLDRPKGTVQTGTDEKGDAWSRTYTTDYGYIPRTKGGDGDGLDVFVGDAHDSPHAYWVTQVDKDGAFDEFKLLLGLRSADEAKKVYADHVPMKFFGGLHEGRVAQVRALLNQDPNESLRKAVEALLGQAD